MKEIAGWALETARLRGASLTEVRIVHERNRADLRVRDDGHVPDRLNAPGLRQGRDMPQNLPRRELDCDETRLQVGGDERDLDRRQRKGPWRCDERRGGQEEGAAVHRPQYGRRAARGPRFRLYFEAWSITATRIRCRSTQTGAGWGSLSG